MLSIPDGQSCFSLPLLTNSTTCSPINKGRFVTRIIEPKELPIISCIITKWQETALLLYQKACEQHLAEADKYLSATHLASSLIYSMTKSPSIGSFIGCFDAALSQLQGIMLLYAPATNRELSIQFLLTNPIHIGSGLPDVANRTHGIGAALIGAAEALCAATKYDSLILTPVPSAESFYTCQGFHKGRESPSTMFKERSEIVMEKNLLEPSDVQRKETPSELQKAAESGDQACIERLLAEGHASDKDRFLALKKAVKKDYREIAALLLAGWTISSENLGSVVCDAAGAVDDPELLNLLLKSGKILELDRSAAAWCASCRGYLRTLELLLANGAIIPKLLVSAIISAAYKGHREVVERLLAHPTAVSKEDKKLAAQSAAEAGYHELAEYINSVTDY